MERELLRLSETPLHLEKTWESGGVPVLTAEVTLPCCGGKSRRARRFDRYYRQYARAYLKYCEAELLPRAAETMHTALERSAPWSCARAVLAYRVTLVRGDILSLYTEGREEHLPPRLTLRRADKALFYRRFRRKKRRERQEKARAPIPRLRAARETAREQMETGTAAYYPNYGALLRRAFSSRSFYLADDGLHWFYPMYSVAPAAEGIVDFSLPYGEAGPLLPAEEEKG